MSLARNLFGTKSSPIRKITPVAPLTCLITGGSRGIGKAIADRFHTHLQAHCILIGRNEATLQSAAHIHSNPTPLHSWIVGDVQAADFWASLAQNDPKLLMASSFNASPPGKPLPTVDILVNAAGIAHSSLFVRTPSSTLDDTLKTNLSGTMFACKYVGGRMLARREPALQSRSEGKSIINVASLLAVQGGRGAAAYAASKAGVLGLTRALAAELGPVGVRVNAIVPGYVETDMTVAMPPEARKKALERIPLKRFATPDEVADAAVFLATNQYANNCVLNLDGGLSATWYALYPSNA